MNATVVEQCSSEKGEQLKVPTRNVYRGVGVRGLNITA